MPDVATYTDYYAGGSIMPGRSFSSSDYRYGFNGQEKDEEVSGSGNSYTAEFWQYDSRLGRRWNIDPVTYPWQSSYATFNNNPILYSDPFGLFGSRKEARQYKRDNNIRGSINKGEDGIFSINNKKEGVSYFKDPSTDNVPNLIGRQDDGVIKSFGIVEDKSGDGYGTTFSERLSNLPKAISDGAVFGYDDPNAVKVGFSDAQLFFLPGANAAKVIEAANGLRVTGFASKHAINRVIGDGIRKGVSPSAILDALKNPLQIKNVVIDQLGRQSQRFIGQFGEVVVNPSTGKIVSVNPTSAKKAAKLLKEFK